MPVNFVMLTGPGRYRLTKQALESLALHTDLSPTSINCTFVLDTFDDFRTEMLVQRFLNDRPNCTSVTVANSGHTLSQLKNLGVAWSEQRFGRGDWLYLSDSDVYFTPNWLIKMTDVGRFSLYEDDDLAPGVLPFPILWGSQIHPFHHPISSELRGMGVDIMGREASYKFTEHSILDGPGWLMPWKTWDLYGPFDRSTAPGVCQSEEYPFCQRLLAGREGPCKCGCHSNQRWIEPCLHCVPKGCAGQRYDAGGHIGVISPHVVIHTGLTHLNGSDAPGRKERELMIPAGVIAL